MNPWKMFARSIALATALLFASTAGVGQEAERIDEVRLAIGDLSSPKFKQRHDAMRQLWALGEVAASELRRAAESPDREIRTRATWALQRIEMGLTPDSSEVIIAAFDEFSSGSTTRRHAALKRLADGKHYRELFRFILSEKNKDVRQQLSRPYQAHYSNFVATLLLEDSLVEYEAMLKWAMETDSSSLGMSVRAKQLVAFWYLQGRLAEEITKMEARAQLDADTTLREMISFGYLLEGDYPNATKWADQAANAYLKLAILYQQKRWSELATSEIAGRSGVELLGFRIAFSRLAGDHARTTQLTEELEKLYTDNESQSWFVWEALMLNGETNRAMRLAQTDQPPLNAFKVLCYQGKFTSAFQLVGLHDAAKTKEWITQLVDQYEEVAERRNKVYPVGLEVARQLHNLEQIEEATVILDHLASQLKTKEELSSLYQLIKLEFSLGLEDRALQHAVLALQLEPNKSQSVIWSLYPKKYSQAWYWWLYIDQGFARLGYRERLERLIRVFDPEYHAEKPLQLQEDIGNYLNAALENQLVKDQVTWLNALAEYCVEIGDIEQARNCYEILITKSPDAEIWESFGDLHLEEENWLEAAKCYESAWEAERRVPATLFKRGYALMKTGDTSGARLMELARLMPLADVDQRDDLADAMDDLGMQDAAIEQWQLILKFGAPPMYPSSFASSSAERKLGNAINDDQPIRAAEHWECWILSLLKTQSYFQEARYYASIPHLIHKNRGQGLLKTGKTNAAIEEFQRSQELVPIEVNLPIDVVPQLDKAGQQAAADQLFRRSFEVHEQIIARYPKSALHYNNAAWLAANCERELEKALQYATKANELLPDHAAYLDTLGEVQFRLGNRDQAIANAKRCLELEPDNDFFQKQLERFQKP